MPDNFDDKQIDNMSIDEINELFKDVIEVPEIGSSCYAITATYGGSHSKQ